MSTKPLWCLACPALCLPTIQSTVNLSITDIIYISICWDQAINGPLWGTKIKSVSKKAVLSFFYPLKNALFSKGNMYGETMHLSTQLKRTSKLSRSASPLVCNMYPWHIIDKSNNIVTVPSRSIRSCVSGIPTDCRYASRILTLFSALSFLESCRTKTKTLQTSVTWSWTIWYRQNSDKQRWKF